MSHAIHRLYVEKLGATERETFTGNEGEIFYDPHNPELYLSDGETAGGTPLIASAIGDLPTCFN